MSDSDKMKEGRLKKLLDKQYRFSQGVMTMKQFIDHVKPTHKTAGDGCYTIWYDFNNRSVGTDIPKTVWDSLDLPTKQPAVIEQKPKRVYNKFVEMAALDMINIWYVNDGATVALIEGEAGESIPEIVTVNDKRERITQWNGLKEFNGMTAGNLRSSDEDFDMAVTKACEVIEELWENYLNTMF